MKFDEKSLLVSVGGDERLDLIEAELSALGYSLGLPSVDGTSVSKWIADGAVGARDPWDDPVDHLVAGYSLRLLSGREFSVPPAPRRSVGPDLFALALGQRERFCVLTSAWLRVHRKGLPAVRSNSLMTDRNPPLNNEEKTLFTRIETELGKS